MEVSLRDMGFGDDNPLISAVLDMIEFADEATEEPETRHHHPSRAYIRETRAMKNTPADVLELPDSYQYLIDMPGLKPEEVKVQVEDDTVLVVSGERRRRKEKAEGVKYLRMERRYGKFMKKFVLPENANREKVEARFENGVLTVTVQKTPPPEPKKAKVIEVKIGGGGGGGESSGAGGEGLKRRDLHESDESHGEGSKEESQTAAQI